MKRGYANTRFGQLHFVSDGTGSPLVCLHPSPRSSNSYWKLLPLWSRTRQVICFDTLGFGRSDPLPANASIEMLADSVADALTDLGIAKVDMFGMHTGNKIAAAFANRHAARLDRLVLCGQSHSLIIDPAARNAAILDLVKVYFEKPESTEAEAARVDRWSAFFETVSHIWWDRATLSRKSVAQEDLDRLERRLLDEVACRHSTAGVYDANFNFSFGDAIATIKAPTQFIELCTDKEDAELGRHGPDLLKALPGSRLATLEHAGPESLEFRADEIADIVERFLAGD